ncbi:MAG TPA: hypothetical protein VGM83_02015 [Devosiaceae bacterium]
MAEGDDMLQRSSYHGIEVRAVANARGRFQREIGGIRRSQFCTEMVHQ